MLPWLQVVFKSSFRNFENASKVVAAAYKDFLTDNVKNFDGGDPRDLAEHFLTVIRSCGVLLRTVKCC